MNKEVKNAWCQRNPTFLKFNNICSKLKHVHYLSTTILTNVNGSFVKSLLSLLGCKFAFFVTANLEVNYAYFRYYQVLQKSGGITAKTIKIFRGKLLLPSNIPGNILKSANEVLLGTLKLYSFNKTLILLYNITNSAMKQSLHSLDNCLLLDNKNGKVQKHTLRANRHYKVMKKEMVK